MRLNLSNLATLLVLMQPIPLNLMCDIVLDQTYDCMPELYVIEGFVQIYSWLVDSLGKLYEYWPIAHNIKLWALGWLTRIQMDYDFFIICFHYH